MTLKRTAILIFAALLAILLGACQQAVSTTESVTVASPNPAMATLQIVLTENAELSTQIANLVEAAANPPTETPSPTIPPTPTATATRYVPLTIPDESVTVTHPAAANYVFPIDPNAWQVDQSAGDDNDFLMHKIVGNCRVDIAPPGEPSELVRQYTTILGRRNWLVQEYAENAYYSQSDVRLDLTGFDDEDCIDEQQALLEGLLSVSEFDGGPPATQVVEPTFRPPIDNFTCEGGLPPRLRSGDRAVIDAAFLWLRKEPETDETTEIKLYPQYGPVTIIVQGGPVCAESIVYWQVEVTELAGDREVYTGWMAESDGENYLLGVWNQNW